VPRSVEFHAVLRRLPRGSERDGTVLREPEAAADMPDWLFDEWSAQDAIRRQRRRIRRLTRKNQRLRNRLDEVRGSASMRLGSALVAPLSALRRAGRRAR
jgi:hypothetical protein